MPENVPINITGGTYRHKSLPLSAQVTRNFWPQLQENSKAKSPYILESFPGLKSFSTIAGNADRGMFEHLGTLYKISETTLYSVDKDGVETSLGTIPGTERCVIEGIGSSIVIVTGGVPYVWNGSTLTTVTDGDLETPNAAAHLNNQILYDGDGGRFVSSAVGDATDIPALNYATAESNADDLVRVYVFDQLAYMLGDKTVEVWWNSGVGSPPFDRVEGGLFPFGIESPYCPANDDEYMYVLGHDHQVYRIQGTSFQNITPSQINREFQSYTGHDQSIGWCMNLFGTWMYVLTFPLSRKTWVYPKNGEWFEWSNGNGGFRSIANSYAYAFEKHLVGDFASGDIYELDEETYTDLGEAIIRLRDSAPIHGGLLGKAGQEMEMSRFELIMETGTGLLTGQGSDPEIMLSWSDDGGKTFSTEQWRNIGKQGQFTGQFVKVEWENLGQFSSRIMRIKTSDPVYYSIHGASADLELVY